MDLAAVARDIVEAFQPAAEEEGKSLTAALELGLPLSGDRELLTQMVANVVDNALRHTPSGTHIVVASALRAGGGRTLTVSDDGPQPGPNETAFSSASIVLTRRVRRRATGSASASSRRSPSCTAWLTPLKTTPLVCGSCSTFSTERRPYKRRNRRSQLSRGEIKARTMLPADEDYARALMALFAAAGARPGKVCPPAGSATNLSNRISDGPRTTRRRWPTPSSVAGSRSRSTDCGSRRPDSPRFRAKSDFQLTNPI